MQASRSAVSSGVGLLWRVAADSGDSMGSGGAETKKAGKMRSGIANLVWLSAVAAIGCATPYQQSSFRGGYSDTRIDSNTVMVSFKGNGFTGRQKVESYLLYTCAESR